MGRRWRRNKKLLYQERKAAKKKAKSGNGVVVDDDEDALSHFASLRKKEFSFDAKKERKDLLVYLRKYKAGAEAFHWNREIEQIEICQDSMENPLAVGEVILPTLTLELLSRPYFAFPADLFSKQRKLVHECSVEVGLFHCSRGTMERQIYVSIYSNGFDRLGDVGSAGTPAFSYPIGSSVEDLHRGYARFAPALYRYRPCFFRAKSRRRKARVATAVTPAGGESLKEASQDLNGTSDPPNAVNPAESDQTRDREDDQGITAAAESVVSSHYEDSDEHRLGLIRRLVDFPEQCFRTGIDRINFKEMEGQDLSTVQGPSMELNAECWCLVDTADKMIACADELTRAQPTEIAFDLEAYNKGKYSQLTCLLQITSSAGKEYVIDPLAPGVFDEVHRLKGLFADPKIVKVGHSIAGLDVLCLHRDFGIVIVNVFDTYVAAQQLRLPGKGLAAVCEYYGMNEIAHYKELKQMYQTGDWHIRPLTDSMIKYGRYDIHYLLQIRRLMMRDLTQEELYYSMLTMMEEQEAVDHDHARGTDRNQSGSGADKNGNHMRTTVLVTADSSCDLRAAKLLNGRTTAGQEDEYSFKTAIDKSCYYTPAQSPSVSRRSSLFESEMDTTDAATPEEPTGYGSSESLAEEEEPFWIADAVTLQRQVRLCKTIIKSQKSCCGIWSDSKRASKDAHLKDPFFESLLTRAKKRDVQWTATNTNLYDELVRWRERVAQEELECLPEFVVPLDFLVAVAWKRPRTRVAIRIISSPLPDVLIHEDELMAQILDIVNKSFGEPPQDAEDAATEEAEPHPCFDFGPNHRKLNSSNLQNEKEKGPDRFWQTVAVASVAAIATVVITVILSRGRINRRLR